MTVVHPTMRAVQYWTNNDIRLVDLPIPTIGPGELLVRIAACGVCGSDVMEWYMRPRAPLFIGHEPVGVVVEVGAGVTEFAVGDRVFIHHHVPCGDCHACRSGRETLCAQFHATKLDPAGLAEYVRVPAPQVAKDVLHLPPSMTWAQATLIEPVACSVRLLRYVSIRSDAVVAVIGCGFNGLVLTRLAVHAGAAAVVAYDLLPFRRERALMLGATAAIDPTTQDSVEELVKLCGRKADVVLVAAGNVGAVRQAFALAGDGATILLFAPPPRGQALDVDLGELFFHEWTLTASYSCGPDDTRRALDLIRSGVIAAEQLVTHQFSLAEAAAAITLTAQPNNSLKCVINVDPAST